MATTPRIEPVDGIHPANLNTVLAHAPQMMTRFGELYGELWQNGELPADLREMTRLRNARVTDCGF